MLLIVLRKMLRNKWLVLCLLIGSILAVAMVSSIPEYSDAIFQRMLTKDLEGYQERSGFFPGHFQVRTEFSAFKENDKVAAYTNFKKEVLKKANAYDVPFLAESLKLSMLNMNVEPAVARDRVTKTRYVTLDGQSGIEDHINIKKGRLYTNEIKDGVIEVIITDKAMEQRDLLLDEVYVIKDTRMVDAFKKMNKPVPKIKVVGIFEMKSETDPYWFNGLNNLFSSFMMDFSLYEKEFASDVNPVLSIAEWYYALNYHEIRNINVSKIIGTYDQQSKWWLDNYRMSTRFTMPVVDDTLRSYGEREQRLRLNLLILQVPILIMLAFYIFMVSQLIIENDKNEIAVLKSRGASKTQIFLTYLIESAILGGIALMLGPPVGMFLCRIIGSSNGFLEFVQRSGLEVHLNLNAYVYAISAVLLFVITMLIPAIASSRTNIVEYKRRRSKAGNSGLWRKYFLDVVLLAASGYGLYRYKYQQKSISIPGMSADDMGMDPGLFLICTLFIIGAGLLFLRFYPYLVRLLFWIGRKIWSPVLYASFIQVGRSGGQEQFIMLFLILTLSVGIFSANTARTINSNIEDRDMYMLGTDIRLKAYWDSNAAASSAASDTASEEEGTEQAAVASGPIYYREPPFSPYTELDGMEMVTKVFIKEKLGAKPGNSAAVNGKVTVMGIIPNEFGKVAWMRDDLLDTHWYNYLNELASNPKAMLVSTSFKEKFKVNIGDPIYIDLGSQQDTLEGVIAGFVDYWPGFNPNMPEKAAAAAAAAPTPAPAASSGNQRGQQQSRTPAQPDPPYLVVANLTYLHDSRLMEPYEVWMKRKADAEPELVYTQVVENNLQPEVWQDIVPQIIEDKNDPSLMGTNGSLTLGFIVTMLISTIGFIIYWVLSIRGRILQFGVLRAMGLTLSRVIGMLVCEQVLISGVAVFLGIIIGGVTSQLFVPMLQVVYSASQQILPFTVLASPDDYIKIYAFSGFMLCSGLLVLIGLVARININQALKLGED